MAIFSSLFVLISLLSSLQIHARDSQLYNNNLIPNNKYLPKVTNFVVSSGNDDYYYYNNNNQLQMDKGDTTSTSTTNPTNTKDYPYKNGGKSDDNNNRYILSEEHVNFPGYHGNEDDYNDEEEPHMP